MFIYDLPTGSWLEGTFDQPTKPVDTGHEFLPANHDGRLATPTEPISSASSLNGGPTWADLSSLNLRVFSGTGFTSSTTVTCTCRIPPKIRHIAIWEITALNKSLKEMGHGFRVAKWNTQSVGPQPWHRHGGVPKIPVPFECQKFCGSTVKQLMIHDPLSGGKGPPIHQPPSSSSSESSIPCTHECG